MRLILLFAVVLLVAPPGGAQAPGGTTGLELVSSSADRVVLRFEPGRAEVSPLSLPGGEFVTVLVGGCDPLGVPGGPDLPAARALVGVPDCDGVDLSISTGPPRIFAGVRVVPSPSVVPVPEGAVSGSRFIEGEPYRRAGAWPAGVATVSAPGMLGAQRVVEVEVHPCQFDASAGALTVHSSIVVTLTFRGARESGRVVEEPARREAMLRAALLNYDGARAWRVPRGRLAERPVGDSFATSANWARMRVSERAVCALTASDLRGAGISPSAIDPRTVRVFTGTGVALPESHAAPRPDWMDECDIVVEGEDDGVFDEGDRIVFCATGSDGWNDEFGLATGADGPYHESRYANAGAYWLTWESPGAPSGFGDAPHRMTQDDLQTGAGVPVFDDYLARKHVERNIYERQGQSDGWFWLEMQQTPLPERRYFTTALDRVRADSTAVLRARVDGGSAAVAYPDHHVLFSLNGELVHTGDWDGYAPYVFRTAGVPVVEGLNSLEVFVPREDDDHEDDRILVDWFELEFWRDLAAGDDRLCFGSSGRAGESRFSIGGFTNAQVSVFKVLDRTTARIVPGVEIEGSSSSFRAEFQDDVSDTASYLAVSAAGFVTPDIERDAPADLRTPTAADYIMITHDDFYDEASRLRNYRESAAGGGFSVRLVRISDVYDEFSWGLEDPTAIRDFLKHTWDNAEVPPTHALLIGDASSDYRKYLTSSTPCHIPVHYETATYSWVAPVDSWYVGFDAVTQYHMAMALGRLPARSASEVGTMVDKIVRYETDPAYGPWRNTAIIVGDDEYKAGQEGQSDYCCEFFHAQQAEQISEEILPWSLDRRKIFLMEYQGDVTGRKPGARSDLIEAWNEGAFLMNYTGHGNEIVLAHESTFLYDDVSLLHNLDALPLFFAASCRLNRFDQLTVDSMGELLAKSPTGGSICSIGSVRDSAAGQNSALNRRFLAAVFGGQRVTTTPVLDVGSAFQAAFTSSPSDAWRNNQLFVLIGDPAVTLATPRGGGEFDEAVLEPMRRRDTVALTGHNEGSTAGEDGLVLLTVAESADTTGYDHVPPPGVAYHVDYTLPGRALYRGLAPVTDGEFAAEFVVSTGAEEGPYARIGGYFYRDGGDGSFSLENVALRDSVDVSDTTGPDIAVEFEGGGTSVLPETAFSIDLFDESGIDLIGRGSSAGAIAVSFDGADTLDVTGEFVYDVGEHREGVVESDLPSLSLGGHTLFVSASDNVGNRSTASQQFEVVSATDFEIRNVACSPNPFPDGETEGTYVLFQLPVAAEVGIDVFTVGGRLVRSIGEFSAAAGANQAYWDGRDAQGDELANGVYLVRIHATSAAYRGDRAEAIGRAVVMR
jgi:hypothetical protein